MAVWDDVEFASPHNQGTCQTLVGDLDAQGDGRKPQANWQDVGGLRGEKKWRPDRTSVPEGQLRGGRGSHAWRDTQGLGSGETCPAYPLSNQLEKSARLLDQVLHPQRPRGGCLPSPLRPGKLAGLPGGVPHPLRPEAEARLDPFYSVEPKPHLPTPPGSFQALWVLSIGSAHHPNPIPAQAPPSTAKVFSTFFFCFFFYYCGSVLLSGCCFIYIFICIFFLTYLLVSQSNIIIIFYFVIVLFLFFAMLCSLRDLGS